MKFVVREIMYYLLMFSVFCVLYHRDDIVDILVTDDTVDTMRKILMNNNDRTGVHILNI
jgi:hypothetical protein